MADLESDFGMRLDNGLAELGDQLKQLAGDFEKNGHLNAKRFQARGEQIESHNTKLQETGERIDTLQSIIEKAIATLRKDTSSAIEESAKQNAAARSRQEASFLERLEVVNEDATQRTKESATKCTSATDAAFNVLDVKLDQALSFHRLATDAALLHLVQGNTQKLMEHQQEMVQLGRAVSMVANIPTRRVEWVIPDASTRFQQNGGEDLLQPGELISVLSKQFDVAGSRGLRFELVRFGGDNADSSDSRDCSLRLMAEKGLRLIFRLCVGDSIHQLEHVFDGEEPFSTGRLCVLSEHICAEDGALRIGLEVLEAINSVESTSGLDAIGCPTLHLDDEDEGGNDTSTFVFHRYMNNRMLDLVQSQVDVMNSRMTRRVEWRIERGSKLPSCFAPGEAMCSSVFQAAGLDGMQLVFYPSGFSGAKDGYCSCFLYYPGRCTLRCWLSVGSQRREAKLSFTSPGFFGRTNFCKLEHGLDLTNNVIIMALEIEEAGQDVVKPMTHQTSHNTSSTSNDATTVVVSGAGDTAIESVLRMQKASGHLQETTQLPSIWTPTPQGDIANALGGFHSIKDLPTKKRPNSLPGMSGPSGASVKCDNRMSPDLYKVRPETISSMSMYSEPNASRPESRQRPGSRLERTASPDRAGALSSMSMYSEAGMQACPPASARPVQRASMRDVLSARYAAYMG